MVIAKYYYQFKVLSIQTNSLLWLSHKSRFYSKYEKSENTLKTSPSRADSKPDSDLSERN